MKVINATEITKNYTQGVFRKSFIRAVDNLTLTVESGQVFGLLGPNGSGKTTLLKVFLNIVFPSNGYASLFGISVNNPESRREVGFLPENPYFYDRMNAWQLLEFYGSIYGMKGEELKKRSSELLDIVGIKDAAKRPLRSYSKGMLQRVGLAQAIISSPKLIFLDEPSTGLDPMGRRMIKDVIHKEKERGTTIVLSSHILSDVQDTCDTIGIIKNGKLLSTASIEQLTVNQHILHIRMESISDGIVDKLKSSTLASEKISDNLLRISIESSKDTPDIIERIVQAGGRIYEVRYQETSLEDIFIQLVDNEGGDLN